MIMGINKLYSNSVINNLMFIIVLVVCSIVGAGPLAVASLAFHLMIIARFLDIFIIFIIFIFILILMIYLFKTLNNNENTKDLKFWLIIFFFNSFTAYCRLSAFTVRRIYYRYR